MKDSTSTFFVLFAETLTIFIIINIIGSSPEIRKGLIFMLSVSFIAAYVPSILLPKLYSKFGYEYYWPIYISTNILIFGSIYIVGNLLGYSTNIFEFIMMGCFFAFITYSINTRLFKQEIYDLNTIIKNKK